jgi:hypothetical protein
METNQNNIIINNFISKYKPKKYNKTNFEVEGILNYTDYFKKRISLTSYKIPELKKIAKHYGLHITGTKPLLIERITTLFNKSKHIIKIQAIFRGWIVKTSMKLRGPALKKRANCVNDNDFVTLEPINEIPISNFYSYMDSKNFVYGFDICSLIHFIRNKNKLENPFNREKFTSDITDNIKKLYRLCFIIFPEFKNENEKLPSQLIERSTNTSINNYTHDQQNRLNTLIINRRNSLSQRIINIFLEIDQLGNYTNSNWFNLSTANYIRLYRHLYDIWYLRSQLSRETRYSICPLNSPFTAERNMFLDFEYIKTACVEVFENLIFMGIDDEHRSLGAFHALTALTIVSVDAREALPWLYESVTVW